MILAALITPRSSISSGRASGPGVVHELGVSSVRQEACPLPPQFSVQDLL